MIAPGVLVIASPILVGTFGGVEAVSGLLAGAIVSSVQVRPHIKKNAACRLALRVGMWLQLAISMSNTGGAWDNAKKYTEKGELNGWFQVRIILSRHPCSLGCDGNRAWRCSTTTAPACATRPTSRPRPPPAPATRASLRCLFLAGQLRLD